MKAVAASGVDYREESAGTSILLTVVVVALIAVPLVLFNNKINLAGAKAADVSTYALLAGQVKGNVRIVRETLEKGTVEMAAPSVVATPAVVAPITPGIAPANMDAASGDDKSQLNVKLSGIYWSPRDPIVTIDNENYQVGGKVKGFTILEIRKTAVVFRSPLGDKVIKYIYDDLESLRIK